MNSPMKKRLKFALISGIIVAFLMGFAPGMVARARVSHRISLKASALQTAVASDVSIFAMPGNMRYESSYDYADEQGFSKNVTFILLLAAVACAGAGIFLIAAPEPKAEASPTFARMKHA